jgi:hypothetical protein
VSKGRERSEAKSESLAVDKKDVRDVKIADQGPVTVRTAPETIVNPSSIKIPEVTGTFTDEQIKTGTYLHVTQEQVDHLRKFVEEKMVELSQQKDSADAKRAKAKLSRLQTVLRDSAGKSIEEQNRAIQGYLNGEDLEVVNKFSVYQEAELKSLIDTKLAFDKQLLEVQARDKALAEQKKAEAKLQAEAEWKKMSPQEQFEKDPYRFIDKMNQMRIQIVHDALFGNPGDQQLKDLVESVKKATKATPEEQSLLKKEALKRYVSVLQEAQLQILDESSGGTKTVKFTDMFDASGKYANKGRGFSEYKGVIPVDLQQVDILDSKTIEETYRKLITKEIVIPETERLAAEKEKQEAAAAKLKAEQVEAEKQKRLELTGIMIDGKDVSGQVKTVRDLSTLDEDSLRPVRGMMSARGFTPEMQDKIIERAEVERAVKRAIENQEKDGLSLDKLNKMIARLRGESVVGELGAKTVVDASTLLTPAKKEIIEIPEKMKEVFEEINLAPDLQQKLVAKIQEINSSSDLTKKKKELALGKFVTQELKINPMKAVKFNQFISQNPDAVTSGLKSPSIAPPSSD